MSKRPLFASNKISLYITALLLVALGLGIGLQIGKTSSKEDPGKTNTAFLDQNDRFVVQAQEALRKYNQQLGSLIETTGLDFVLKGKVIEIKDDSFKGENSAKATPGKSISLENQEDKATVFVYYDADVYEGKENEYDSWKDISLDDIKAGDLVKIRVNYSLTTSAPDKLWGWWVFKME